jgi:para-nitrobenzyl esterase
MRAIIVSAAILASLGCVTAAAADQAPAAAASKAVYSTAETTIGTLLDDPDARAVLEKYMPGFSTRDQIAMARPMTLRGIQTYDPDELTDDLLGKIDADLAKLPAKK